MKILLINPNRVRFPPVPPIGLEYLSDSLVKGGHVIRLLDLTFHENAEVVIDEVVSELSMLKDYICIISFNLRGKNCYGDKVLEYFVAFY